MLQETVKLSFEVAVPRRPFFSIRNHLPTSDWPPGDTVMLHKRQEPGPLLHSALRETSRSSPSAFLAPLWGKFYYFSHFLHIREWKQRRWVTWVRPQRQSTTQLGSELFGLTLAPRSNLVTRAPWKLIAGHWQQGFTNHIETVVEARGLEKRYLGMTESNDTFSEIWITPVCEVQCKSG